MSVTTPALPFPAADAEPLFRGRIGGDARSGHYAVPHRYRLHLAADCPDSLRLAVTHGLLGLGDTLPVTHLPAVPAGGGAGDGGHPALRPLYAASAHGHHGPATAPVLADEWTGRIVSNHAPHILADLARRFGGGHGPELHPDGAGNALAEVRRLCDQDIETAARLAAGAGGGGDTGTTGTAGTTGAAGTTGTIGDGTTGDGGDRAGADSARETLLRALHTADHRLSRRRYLLGDHLTLADVTLWVTLLRLDGTHRPRLDPATARRVTGHPHLWAYARGLAEHPAFGVHLGPDDAPALRRPAVHRGREAAGTGTWPVARAGERPAERREPEERRERRERAVRHTRRAVRRSG
ncbi:glutathione S-transferase C-terminal domain-containing protein [Streptomyces zingiberis]|uniref:Glutathione S-transferase family protein n=1 Tax=Streptomyces zingiberis TaxID=2053010 RepID=A0ABX1BVX3_9ACTN|nr:glutathione S-transferase C-terminal domain-containing protein [Streptomyces zingiberis]NJQ01223.1 glutathione S-transferase family protein [Streptomyces zingiberis]